MKRLFLTLSLFLFSFNLFAETFPASFPDAEEFITAAGASGAILLPNGSASAPSLSFASDTDVGWYHTGTGNQICLTSGGACKYTFNATSASFGDNAITNVGDIALDSISPDATNISIAIAAGELGIGDGTYSFNHSPNVGIEGILEVDGVLYAETTIQLENDEQITNATNGKIKFAGTGQTNNETLTCDFESTANKVLVTSGSGVTSVDYGTINLETDAIDLSDGDITNALYYYVSAPSSDVAPNPAMWKSADAYSQASTQTKGALACVMGGIEQNDLTISDYTLCSTDVVTVKTVLACGTLTTTTLTEGTDWDAITDNATAMNNLMTAVAAITGLSGSDNVSNIGYAVPDKNLTFLDFASADGGVDGACVALAEGQAGEAVLPQYTMFESGFDTVPTMESFGGNWRLRTALKSTRAVTGYAAVSLDDLVLDGKLTLDEEIAFTSKSTIDGSTTDGNTKFGNAAKDTGINLKHATADTLRVEGYSANTGGSLEVTGDHADNGSYCDLTDGFQETLTFAGGGGDASKTSSGQVPDGAFNIKVLTRNLVAGTGCGGMRIGDGSDTDLFGEDLSVSASAVTSAQYYTAVPNNPILVGGAFNVVIAGTDGAGTPTNCVDLSVRLVVMYEKCTGPTS